MRKKLFGHWANGTYKLSSANLCDNDVLFAHLAATTVDFASERTYGAINVYSVDNTKAFLPALLTESCTCKSHGRTKSGRTKNALNRAFETVVGRTETAFEPSSNGASTDNFGCKFNGKKTFYVKPKDAINCSFSPSLRLQTSSVLRIK